jgi:hypothetical protein
MLGVLAAALLPACNFTIRTVADWQRVNDSDKTVICVAAAPTYTYEQVGIVQLTASGTADKPRWLRWSNQNESLHPALVPAGQTAAVAQFDLRGSYWIIDRIVVRDAIAEPRIFGTGNVLQRMVFEKPRAWAGRNIGLMLNFWSGSDNTIVDSVFRDPFRAPGVDGYAIYINEAERITVRGNEFIDLVDGVSNGPLAGGGNRFVENEFYQTSASYTDCSGRFDPQGSCACSEGMAVSHKGPATKPESFVERNLVWGFKKTDPRCAGTGTPGIAFDFGAAGGGGSPPTPTLTRHFTVRDNIVIADMPFAIYLGREIEDVAFIGNYVAEADYGISNAYGQRVTVQGNIFFHNGNDYVTGPSAQGTIYQDNRRAGTGQLCVTIRHITNPDRLCTAY